METYLQESDRLCQPFFFMIVDPMHQYKVEFSKTINHLKMYSVFLLFFHLLFLVYLTNGWFLQSSFPFQTVVFKLQVVTSFWVVHVQSLWIANHSATLIKEREKGRIDKKTEYKMVKNYIPFKKFFFKFW